MLKLTLRSASVRIAAFPEGGRLLTVLAAMEAFQQVLNPSKWLLQEFAALAAAGIVYHSTSPWASSLHMGHMANESWWPCRDY